MPRLLRGGRRSHRARSDPDQRQRFPCHPGRSVMSPTCREPRCPCARMPILGQPAPARRRGRRLAGMLRCACLRWRRAPTSSSAIPPSSRVGVAIGYQDTNGWATEGWWNIASQTCETLLRVRFRAASLRSRRRLRPRRRMGRQERSCARPTNRSPSGGFRIAPNAAISARASSRWTPARRKEWTIRLTDPSEGRRKTGNET